MDIGVAELAVVLIVVVFVFGPKKLPELARSLGQALHEWRDAAHERPSSDVRAFARRGAHEATPHVPTEREGDV